MQLIGINRCPHIIAIYQKYFSNKAQDFSESSEYLFLSSFYVTKWLFFLTWNKKSWSLLFFEKFLGSPFSLSNLQSSLWVTFWLTLQYLPTLIRKSLSVPATSTQAGWYGCWKKKALSFRRICQHATILEGQSWALDCFCHCNVFLTLNWLLSFIEMDLHVMLWIHNSHFWI